MMIKDYDEYLFCAGEIADKIIANGSRREDIVEALSGYAEAFYRHELNRLAKTADRRSPKDQKPSKIKIAGGCIFTQRGADCWDYKNGLGVERYWYGRKFAYWAVSVDEAGEISLIDKGFSTFEKAAAVAIMEERKTSK